MLAELPGQHAVDGVQRHAQDHPQGDQGEQPQVAGETGDHHAHQHRDQPGQHGDLVGGGAVVVKTLYQRPQQVLKARFELINREHGGTVPCHAGEAGLDYCHKSRGADISTSLEAPGCLVIF